MFNISFGGSWPVIKRRFTAATEAHLYKHTHENPEIQPHFVERFLLEAEPRFLYPDHVSGRYVVEGYIVCKPYRVVVEVMEENGLIVLIPISAHRISHKNFIQRLRRQEA
jgi:hypothetical protein